MGAQQFYIDRKNTQESYQHDNNEKAKVELPIILLEKLILSGLLPGNECKCLDDAARKTVWKSILQGSLNGEQSLCL
jgi:hypothetical protein